MRYRVFPAEGIALKGECQDLGGGDYCRFADKMGWNIDILAAVMKRMHTTRLGSSGLKHSRSY